MQDKFELIEHWIESDEPDHAISELNDLQDQIKSSNFIITWMNSPWVSDYDKKTVMAYIKSLSL